MAYTIQILAYCITNFCSEFATLVSYRLGLVIFLRKIMLREVQIGVLLFFIIKSKDFLSLATEVVSLLLKIINAS